MNALALANSYRVKRGVVGDDLDPSLGLHALRDAIRSLFAAAADGVGPATADIELLNRLAEAPCLGWDPAGGPKLTDEGEEAEAARTAIELLASRSVRACGNPRCVRFYLGQGRRRYCSDACANRTRVARHAARSR